MYIIQNLSQRKIEKYFPNSFSDNPDDFNVSKRVLDRSLCFVPSLLKEFENIVLVQFSCSNQFKRHVHLHSIYNIISFIHHNSSDQEPKGSKYILSLTDITLVGFSPKILHLKSHYLNLYYYNIC